MLLAPLRYQPAGGDAPCRGGGQAIYIAPPLESMGGRQVRRDRMRLGLRIVEEDSQAGQECRFVRAEVGITLLEWKVHGGGDCLVMKVGALARCREAQLDDSGIFSMDRLVQV